MQELVRASQASEGRAQHLQRNQRIVPNKSEKVIPRQDRQPRRFRDDGVGRALLAIDDRHLAKKIALRQLGQGDRFLIVIRDRDAHAAAFDQIHRIAIVAGAKERGAGSHVTDAQQVAQFARSLVIQRREQRNGTKRIQRHLWGFWCRHGVPQGKSKKVKGKSKVGIDAVPLFPLLCLFTFSFLLLLFIPALFHLSSR